MNPASSHGKSNDFPLLLLLFVGSGCSALVYEMVWFQLLRLVIGSSAVSLGVLLATFMGGMGLGSILLPRLVGPKSSPLVVYGLLELGIAIAGVTLLTAMPAVSEFYLTQVENGQASLALRAAVCAGCLLLPTMMMGATLPAIARWLESTPEGVSRLGFFYGANIVGAVFGCVLAGYYLLPNFDVRTATLVAVVINVIVATLSWYLAARSPRPEIEPDSSDSPAARSRHAWLGYLVIGLSGLTALGAEALWTRQLSLILGATTFAFSGILAVFLVGLGIGSSVGAAWSAKLQRPRIALAWCQFLLTICIAWATYFLLAVLPSWRVPPNHFTTDLQLQLLQSVWVFAIVPAAALWGASFPLALASVAARGLDPGRLVGGVYAANTLGAIAGSLVFSMVSISSFGMQGSVQCLIGLAAVAALLSVVWSKLQPQTEPAIKSTTLIPRLLTAAVVVGCLIVTVPATPAKLIGFGRSLPLQKLPREFLYSSEGTNASIAVSEDATKNERYFHVSGKVVASSKMEDMRLQRLLAHIPALLHSEPKTVLVVGCGAGVTAGSFLVHPSVEKVVICEIEPLIPLAAGKYFGKFNHHVIDDPRVEVVIDDARHFMMTTDQKFDIITSDPIHPWVKGAATLYSEEYFELTKRHLHPGGLTTQWLPLYESTVPAVKSSVVTFVEVFPQASSWSNPIQGHGYDTVLLGMHDPRPIRLAALEQRINRPDHATIKKELEEIQFPSALELLANYVGRKKELAPWLADAQVNRDSNLRLQYLAARGIGVYHHAAILQDMVQYRKFPDGFIEATGKEGEELRERLN